MIRPAMRAAPALTNRPHSRFVRSGLSSHSGPARACVRLRPSPRPVTCPVAFRPSGEDSPPRASRVAHDVHGPHDPTVVPTLVGPVRAVALRVPCRRSRRSGSCDDKVRDQPRYRVTRKTVPARPAKGVAPRSPPRGPRQPSRTRQGGSCGQDFRPIRVPPSRMRGGYDPPHAH